MVKPMPTLKIVTKTYDSSLEFVATKAEDFVMGCFTKLQPIRNTNTQYPDISLFRGGELCAYVEVEYAIRWSGGAWPYPTVHIPKRKKKYTSLSVPTFFVVVNGGYDQMLLIPEECVLSSAVVVVKTKYNEIGEAEEFYDVDTCHIFYAMKESLEPLLISELEGIK